MKVAIIIRSTADKITGGDTIQARQTAVNLKKFDVEAHVYLANATIDYSQYNLLHFFNLLRPGDHIAHINKSGLPYVVSPIYLDYSNYDRNGRAGFSKLIFRLTGKHFAEYLKNMARFMTGQDHLESPSYILGHFRAMRHVWKNAAAVLPNSASEYSRLLLDFNYAKHYQIVPNGVDQNIFSTIPDVKREADHVICVGQVYGRKNQHRLIQACNKLDLKLSIIGKSPPNHKKYLDYCKSIAGNKVRFIDYMPQHKLLEHYASAAVHALPSWFETTGLSSLEAGAMGCNLVVGSGGDTRDYFEPVAEFCSANDLQSIIDALTRSLAKKCDQKNSTYILSRFTWEHAARETQSVYRKVLNNA